MSYKILETMLKNLIEENELMRELFEAAKAFRADIYESGLHKHVNLKRIESAMEKLAAYRRKHGGTDGQ